MGQNSAGSKFLGARVRQQISWLWSGYKPRDFQIGAQVAVGWACLLGIYAAPAAWDRLEELGANPAIVFLAFAGLCQPITGAVTVGVTLAFVAAGTAAGLAYIPIALAYAAGGGEGGTDDVSKAVVMVAVAAVLGGLLAIGRMRFPALDLPFYYTTYGCVIAAFSSYWQPTPWGLLPIVEVPRQMAYMLPMLVAVTVAVALPVSWLVLPLPAGRVARKLTCGALGSVGRLTEAVIELCVTGPDSALPENPKDTKAVDSVDIKDEGPQDTATKGGKGSDGSMEGGGDMATRLPQAEVAAKAEKDLVDLQQSLEKLPLLLLATRAELDIYAKQKRFPSKAFSNIVDRISTACSGLGLVLRPLARVASEQVDSLGLHLPPVLPLNFSACRATAPELLATQRALTGCCSALEGVLGQDLPMTAALEQLQELETSFLELHRTVGNLGGASSAAVSLRAIYGLLRHVGLQVRFMFPDVAAAVEQQQPGAVALIKAHLQSFSWPQPMAPGQSSTGSDGGEGLLAAAMASRAMPSSADLSNSEAAAKNGDARAPAEHLPGSVAVDIGSSSAPTAEGSNRPEQQQEGPPPTAGQPAAASPERETLVIDRPCSEVVRAPRGGTQLTEKICRWLDKAGLGQPQLRPGLHLALSVVLAGPFVVVRPLFKALDYKGAWVVITVNSVFERCMGNVRSRALNRTIGTLVGMVWACACLGFSYLASGSTWNNNPGKYVTMACLLVPWGFFVGCNRNRHPRYSYSWSMLSVTVCVVVLEGFKQQETPWTYAAFRMACVAIGIVIDILVSTLVLPVSVEQVQRQQLQQGLGHLAALVQQVAALQAGQVPCNSEHERMAAAKALKATQKKVRTAALRMSKMEENVRLESKWWPSGPTGSSGGARGSAAQHQAVADVCSYLMQLEDLFVSVAQVQLTLSAALVRLHMTPTYVELCLAVAEQVSEALRALSLALSGVLPMQRVLRTLRSLDALLRQLAGETVAGLQREQEARSWGEGVKDGQHQGVTHRQRTSFAFAAAGLGSARLLRRLFHAAALALLPLDPGAAEVAAQELHALAGVAVGGPAAAAALEQAAIAAAFSAGAEGEGGARDGPGSEGVLK